MKTKPTSELFYICRNPQKIINKKEQIELIKLYHDTPCGGHFGVIKNKTNIYMEEYEQNGKRVYFNM